MSVSDSKIARIMCRAVTEEILANRMDHGVPDSFELTEIIHKHDYDLDRLAYEIWRLRKLLSVHPESEAKND